MKNLHRIIWTEKLGEGNHKEILSKELQTKTFREIAKDLDISATSVSRYCNKLKIKSPRRYNKINWEKKLFPFPGYDIKEKLKNLHKKYGFWEIVDLLNISSCTVQRKFFMEKIYKPRRRVSSHSRYDYLSELNAWKATSEGKEFTFKHSNFMKRQKELKTIDRGIMKS